MAAPPQPEPIGRLLEAVKGLGHPEFPLLHKTYSPASRIPCADFSPFIIDRLRSGDLASISQLMRGILAANPGLGIGPEWIDGVIKDVVGTDFHEYVTFDTPETELELKALFIIMGKEGGGREFFIADDSKAGLFSLALSSQRPVWRESMGALRDKANHFIREMAKDIPLWKDYPRFRSNCFRVDPPPVSSALIMIRKLSIAARIHLLDFARFRVSGSLPKSTTYAVRSLGLNPEETAREIVDSGLCVPTHEDAFLLRVWNRNDLIQACVKTGAEYRKSWKKEELFGVLRAKAPELIREALERENPVMLNPQFKAEICSLEECSRRLEDAFKLICFA